MLIKIFLLALLVVGFLFNGTSFAEDKTEKLQFGSQKDRPMIERVERVTLRKKEGVKAKKDKKKKGKKKAKKAKKAKKKKQGQ